MDFACSLQQIEFLSPSGCRTTVVHLKLVVNVIGVSTHRAQRHHESVGNFRAIQFGSEQLKHFKFTFAQWLDSKCLLCDSAMRPLCEQVLVDRSAILSLAKCCQELTDIVRRDCVFRGLFQQLRHG